MARGSGTILGAHVVIFVAALAAELPHALAENRTLRVAVLRALDQFGKDEQRDYIPGWELFVSVQDERGGMGPDGRMYNLSTSTFPFSRQDVPQVIEQVALGIDCQNRSVGDFHAVVVLSDHRWQATFSALVLQLQALAIPSVHAGGARKRFWEAKNTFTFAMLLPQIWFTREALRVSNIHGLQSSVIVGSVWVEDFYALAHASVEWSLNAFLSVVGPSASWCRRRANATNTCRLIDDTCHCGKQKILDENQLKYDLEHESSFYELKEVFLPDFSNCFAADDERILAYSHDVLSDVRSQGETADIFVNLAILRHSVTHALFVEDLTPKVLLDAGTASPNSVVDRKGILNATHGYWGVGFGQWHKAMRFEDPMFGSSTQAVHLYREQVGRDMTQQAAVSAAIGSALHIMLARHIDTTEFNHGSVHVQRDAVRHAFGQLFDATIWGNVRFNRAGQNNGRDAAAWQIIPDAGGVPHSRAVLPTAVAEHEIVIPAPTWSSRFGCPPGSYNTGYKCEECPVGKARSTRNPGLNVTECFLCVAGRGAGEAGQSECDLCSPGRSHKGNIGYCVSCSVGTFASVSGSTACSLCLPGRFQDGTHPTACKDCLAGRYRGTEDLGCRDCSSGYFSAVSGNEACEACKLGKYASESRSTQCVACPVAMTTIEVAATSLYDCVCQVGYYMPCLADDLASCIGLRNESLNITPGCTSCGDGFTCSGGLDLSTTWHSQPIVAQGYYAERNEPYTAYACNPPTYCLGGAFEGCAGGRSGRACALCPQGRWSTSSGVCEKCHPVNVVSAISYWPLVVIGCIGFYYLLDTPLTSKATTLFTTGCTFGLMMNLLQALGIFLLFSVPWPPAIKELMRISQVFMLDLDIFSPSCIMKGSSFLKYLSSVLFFFQVALILVVFLPVSQAAPPRWRWSRVKTANVFGGIAQISFTTMAAVSMTPMMCVSQPEPNPATTLLRYPDVLCGSPIHLAMLGVGIPLLVSAVCFCAVIVFMCVVAPAKASAGSVSFMQAGRFLFFRFRPEAWWWGCTMLARAVLLSLLPVLATDTPRVQMFCAVVLFGITGALQVRFWPWKVPLLNVVDAVIVFLLLMTITTSGGFLPGVQGVEKDAHITGAVAMLILLYASPAIVFLMAVGTLVMRGPKSDAHPAFLLRRAPDRQRISAKLEALGKSVSKRTATSLDEVTSNLPFYDLSNIERALTVLDEVIIAYSKASKKFRTRVHIVAKQVSLPATHAESAHNGEKASSTFV